jgi:hypothetical protein
VRGSRASAGEHQRPVLRNGERARLSRALPAQLDAHRVEPEGVRDRELPQTGAEPGRGQESPSSAATMGEAKKERTPRLDWAGLLRRSFALDVFVCVR